MGFALNEKVRKELFVISVTNSKTKKLALQLLNHMPNPVSLVSKKGQILFCNNQFEMMLKNRLGSKGMPPSIFKMISEEDNGGQRLKGMIDEALKNMKEAAVGGCGQLEMTMNQAAIMGAEKLPKIEVLLKKNVSNLKPTSPLFMGKSPSEARNSNLDETKSNIDKSAALQKDIFESKNIL
jgi:hypothetical protein